MKTLLKFRYLLVLSLVAFGFSTLVHVGTEAARTQPDAVTVRAAGRGRPFLNLRDGHALTSNNADAAEAGLAAPLASGNARPLTLATADFDIDGAPDLLSGYAVDNQGLVTLRRGNIDAYAPTSPDILQAIQQGHMPDSLLADVHTFAVPEAPDFLLAGDFNHDGFQDALVAARGGNLYLLAGDGTGNFSAPTRVKLPGSVTAIAAGQFNRVDGVTDVAVAVNGAGGAAVAVFTQGLPGPAETFTLPGEATALALGRLDQDFNSDLAVAVGSEIEIIHGTYEQTQTGRGLKGASLKGRALKGETVASQAAFISKDVSAQVERVTLPAPVRALTLGAFVFNRDNRPTIAALTADGTIHLLAPGDLDMRPFTPDELEARIQSRAQVELDTQTNGADLIPAWRPSADNAWQLAGQLGSAAPVGDSAVGQALMPSFLTYGDSADLIVVNAGAQQLNIVRNVGAQMQGEKAQALSLAALPQAAALDVAGVPVAALELPRQVNGNRTLVMLQQDTVAPSAIIAAPLATISVDRTDDVAAASACTASSNDCSLRGAVSFANANPGTTINVPANTYQLTVAGANETANATGDLDVTASGTTITGAGAATTIIQQTTTDRVILFNPPANANFTAAMSGVTIKGGSIPTSSSLPGGAGILIGGASNTYTISSCIFDSNNNNANIAGNGGGVDFAPLNNSTDVGTVSFTSTTFSNNSSLKNVGGGFAFRNAPTGSATFTSCTFTNNQTPGNAGGAVSLLAAGSACTYTFSKCTFTGNIAGNSTTPSTAMIGGAIDEGNGAITMHFCRIKGNTAFAPGGPTVRGDGYIVTGNGTNTVTQNWWGCNGDPTTGATGCDSVVQTSPGTATVNPRLQLTHTGNPSTILVDQCSTLTASFLKDSNGSVVAASNLDVLIGLSITFNNAVKGSLSAAQATIQSTGTATATFAASAAGTGTADAIVDSVQPSASDPSRASITINKANTSTSITSDTPDPTVTGQSYTVDFQVSISSSTCNVLTVPTGNVTVTADTGEQCTGAINGSGAGSCSITVFHAGNRTMTAAYAGDSNFNTSSSSPATAHTVNKADTTTTITSDDPDPSVTGQSVTVAYSVSVNAPGSAQASNPTGNVVVTVDGNSFCTGTVAATGSCSATLTTAGPHSFVATYQGDANYNASLGSASAAHTVNKADTTASILSQSLNPTTRGQQFAVGYAVAVNSPGAGSPTGNVVVTDGVDSCTGTVAAGTCNLTLFTVGVRTLTATYQGDSNFNASPASSGVSHTVNKINTTTAVQSSKNPSDVGNNVTFTATITPASGSDVPTGTVQFRDGPSGTGTPIGSPATVSGGVATVQTSALTPGLHTITADYSGDTNLNSSSGALAGGQLVIDPTPTSPGDILISEFRFHGTTSQDEFIELYNNTNHPITVGSSGYPLMAINQAGTTSLIFTVPANTTFAAGAHYLITNQTTGGVGFSLGSYPAGVAPNPTTVGTGDGNYANLDIDDGGGVALFNTPTTLDATTRLDAVGFATAPDALYRQGAGLAPAGGITANGQYSFARKQVTGLPQNTPDNAADFDFVANDAGTYSGVAAVLGAPGPESSASPVLRNATIKPSLIDPQQASSATPNRIRDNTSGGAGTPTAFGTLEIRRKFTNNTGAAVTRLRFRVIDITTTNSPNGPVADMRVLNSTNTTVTITGGSNITVLGTTVETPPTQASGGGLNSSVTVTIPGGQIANGASVNVRFVLGVAQGGAFRFFINTEGLP